MVCGVLSAQGPQKQDENAARMAAGSPPIYRISVTARTARRSATSTAAAPRKSIFSAPICCPTPREAKGREQAGAHRDRGGITGLQGATKNGPNTSLMCVGRHAGWPHGHLGEVLLNGSKSKMTVTTELQVFGLVVTANLTSG